MNKRTLILMTSFLLVGVAACGDDESAGSSDDFCADAQALEDSNTDELFLSEDPAEIEKSVNEFLGLLKNAADSAPDEVADQVETLRDAFAGIAEGLEEADWDFIAFASSPEAADLFTAVEEADFDELDTYLSEECGIDRELTSVGRAPADARGTARPSARLRR